MANIKVTPRSLTDAYKRREGDFAPNLVGLQFTDGTSLFTFGNFQVTTNYASRTAKDFKLSGEWSEYYSLENLNITPTESKSLESNNISIRLNFDPYNISRFVYFGSFYELTKVTIENIISKWKGSLYVDRFNESNAALNTVLSFSYNVGDDTSTFIVPTEAIVNKFQLNYASTSTIPVSLQAIPSEGEIYDLNYSYSKYVVWNQETNSKFSVIGFTGSTEDYPYIKLQTKGNPFPTMVGSFTQFNYHVMPMNSEVDLFFNQLKDFEKIILNNLTVPLYTSTFTVPQEADGLISFVDKSFTWPCSDGYNLDIDTPRYGNYIKDILETSSNFDTYKTDLVSTRFVSESILDFDTDGSGTEIYGRKIKKLLRIYGREFDEVKKYIDGISFANVVTYDKLDNTSDDLIKMMAKNLGFDVLLTTTNNNFNLLQQLETTDTTVFEGYSRSLSSKELEVEFWRRMVINAWWLYKSKGTRKVIEFFFKLFKVPECMVTLNEYVYLAKDRLDTFAIYDQLLNVLNLDIPLGDLPIDVYGFPNSNPNALDNYFQMGGFWYNGGSESVDGNNPHIGPYDYGVKYFDKYKCFVPNFNSYLTGSPEVTIVENNFKNYNNGTFISDNNPVPLPPYGDIYAQTLNDGLVKNGVVNSAGLTKVGNNNAPKYGRPSGDTYSMKISFTAGDNNSCITCPETYSPDNGVIYTSSNGKPLTNQSCCQFYWLGNVGGISEGGGVTISTTTYPQLCYSCLPSQYVIPVCGIQDWITKAKNKNIDVSVLAKSYGWNSGYALTPEQFLTIVLKDSFTPDKCVIFNEPDLKPIKSQHCCRIVNGEWDYDTNTCYSSTTNKCSTAVENEYHIFVDGDGKLLSEDCCTNLNYDSTTGYILLNINGGKQVVSDNVGISYMNKLGLNNQQYCTACPTNLSLDINNVITKNSISNSLLTPKCCTDYGFYYNTTDNKCLMCPNTSDLVNNIYTDGYTYTVTDTKNVGVSEYCCNYFSNTVNNTEYWYGINDDVNSNIQKCYLCEPINEGSYSVTTVVTNPIVLWNQHSTPTNTQKPEVILNGESLTKNCCEYYKKATNNSNVTWNDSTKKCIIL